MTLLLNVAGWPLRLICSPPTLAERAAVRYAAFVAPAAPSAPGWWTVEMAVSAADDRANPAPSALLDANIVLKDESYLLDAVGISGRIVVGERQALLQCAGREPLQQLEYFLRIVIAVCAYHAGGLLVHAAALRREGRVHLFIGPSGSGKSTVVALSPQATALGDDLIVLLPHAYGWHAYGTPFWNAEARDRSGETASGPLVGIYKLIQDRQVFAEMLPPAAAVAELLANCPVVNGIAADLPGLVNRCRALARAVPVKALHFRRDPDFWQLIE